ncbi:hypothetical protein BCR32DRAFT_329845 [Anaeromyces robustus]|uniref:RGS domain-containing protein n=1 Tax=Anaeromyces robustus TaxID=1754192 RepID=A0A1Y1WP96_9FUNG|nr:hypothetical protein BCR32DRAFT_329845 [Anaeromyces robustus]|eukprot:ORX75369.1 hypothetical protein BCR32DRAFT_329845 [Anaeromyces robustus]
MLHEKYRRRSVEKVEVIEDDEVNEMEITNFEKVLNPKCAIYKEFKRFLVGEVCIENLLFYEAMINILLKCQNASTKSNSWNLKELVENPHKYTPHNETTIKINDEEIPYYESLYKTAMIVESPEIKNHLIRIFEKFIPEGSEYQLNLTSELVKSVEHKIHKSENIDILLFKPVLKEVYELLRWTNYPRFLQTKQENKKPLITI